MDISSTFKKLFLPLIALASFHSSLSFAEEGKPHIVQFEDSYIGKTESLKNLLNAQLEKVRTEKGSSGTIEYKKVFDRRLSAAVINLTQKEAALIEKLDFVQHVEIDRMNAPGWGPDRINQRHLPLDNNYSYAYQGAGVDIYVVDTGINPHHQEFTGRVGTVASVTGGNGHDCLGHGTYVASAAAGATVGAASDATINSVQVSDSCSSDLTSTSNILSGLIWILQNVQNPSVINYSYESSSTLIRDRLDDLVDDGHVVVVIAGNFDSNTCTHNKSIYPRSALTVGSTDNDDTRSSFSNYGFCNDIFAPGRNIEMALHDDNNGYDDANGTSYAAPFVSGIAASYMQRYPNATQYEVMEAILDGATTGVVNDTNGSPNRLAYIDIAPPEAYWRVNGHTPTPVLTAQYGLPAPGCSVGSMYVERSDYAPDRIWECR